MADVNELAGLIVTEYAPVVEGLDASPLLAEVVGDADVLQQIPFSVQLLLPLFVRFPYNFALVGVIIVGAVPKITVGAAAGMFETTTSTIVMVTSLTNHVVPPLSVYAVGTLIER